jgi:hypothetical protein
LGRQMGLIDCIIAHKIFQFSSLIQQPQQTVIIGQGSFMSAGFLG